MRGALVLAFALQVGCSSGGGTSTEPPSTANPPAAPATAEVQMQSGDDGYGQTTHTFVPARVTVARGGAVTWSNSTSVLHNVTFAAAAGAPANISDHVSGTTTRTFSTAGTFSYACSLHAGMTGTVEVAN